MKTARAEIVPRPEEKFEPSDVLPPDVAPLEIGQWYWVTGVEDEPWFACITEVGSNYAEVTGVDGVSTRVHLNEFDSRCKPEPNPEKVIRDHVADGQRTVQALMQRVVEVTARLGVGAAPALQAPQETMALATVASERDFGRYRKDLVAAKDELLPELFKQIEDANRELVTWLKAQTIPFRAKVDQMQEVLGRIDDRIFNVDLYAGLSEQVERIADGAPAAIGEKIRLMQRRCYMDEECLAQYETGGMEFKDLAAFDAWLCRPENRDRLLPFERCIVAFRVRREHKARATFGAFIDFLRIIDEMRSDKYSFLYIRNGERLYRMNTELEFGEKLFPDLDARNLGGEIWAEVYGDSVRKLVTGDQFRGLCEDYDRGHAEHEKERKAQKKEHAAWKRAKREAKRAGKVFEEPEPWFWDHFSPRDPRDEYQRFEPENLYYDDIKRKIERDIQDHNRIALIIQGFLDRSPILHPHPPWKIWSDEGFRQALELVYDESRALVGGEKPDFEAYRASLNASIQAGSVTVGQQAMWVAREQEKERRDRIFGAHGPGTLARVVHYAPRSKRLTYAWNREAQSRGRYGEPIRMTFSCDAGGVLNADAYTPGDFRKFFADPRTRAEYLQWAPLLLEAEEYRAGNRDVPLPPEATKRQSSSEGRRAYRRRKLRAEFLHKLVQNEHRIETKSGKVYPPRSLWRVSSAYRGLFTIVGVLPDGTDDGDRFVTGVDMHNLTIVGETSATEEDD